MTVTINGTTGYSGPVGTIGDLTTTGNTTLGDASGDTLTLNGNTASIPNGLNFTNGNIGVGVTPSTIDLGKFLEVGQLGCGVWTPAVRNIVFNSNAYYNGGNKYATTGAAGSYQIANGVHYWYNAGSGTAGNAITFTQAMTLDASGQLVIGATSTSQKLRVYDSGSNTTIRAENGTSAFEFQSNVNDGYINMNGTGNIIFRNGSGFTERARIDSSGNLLIGTTSGAGSGNIYLGIAGASLTYTNASSYLALITTTATPIAFLTNNSERARIDSSGSLLVGTTTATGGGILTNCPSGWGIARYMTDQSGRRNWAIVTESLNAGDFCILSSTTNNGSPSTVRLQIRNDGSCYNGNGTWGSLSDAKIKENVVDATPKLGALMQVRVVNYNRIGEERKELGVIAQELEAIFPNMVDESEDLVDGQPTGTTTKAVKYSVFVPMLIKAIQELKAEFDAYKLTHP